jgi:hypothetical protein
MWLTWRMQVPARLRSLVVPLQWLQQIQSLEGMFREVCTSKFPYHLEFDARPVRDS